MTTTRRKLATVWGNLVTAMGTYLPIGMVRAVVPGSGATATRFGVAATGFGAVVPGFGAVVTGIYLPIGMVGAAATGA